MISDINIRIDRDKCTACGNCVERCIMDNLRLSVAPCRQACPLHMNCQSYIRFLAQDMEDKAIEQVTPYLPFLGILGRICSQPCEAVCERGNVDEPVSIRAIKRYLAERCEEKGIKPEPKTDSGCKVAVIGSGPAGLMAAFKLRMDGHKVVVFEAEDKIGGLMRTTIPAYRLPESVLDKTEAMMSEIGIEFKAGSRIGDDELAGLKSDYDAVIVALGAGLGMTPPIKGADQPKVVQAIDLLKEIKAGGKPVPGDSVIIVGGGETSIGAALACKRLGVKSVRMVCLEAPAEMPASKRSLEEAREEGVQVDNCWGVSNISETSDGMLELGLSRCLSVTNEKGEFAPQIEPVCIQNMFADTVVLATGQKLDLANCPSALARSDRGFLKADCCTNISADDPKIFICGDAHTGPTTVTAAMASGEEAAKSVCLMLDGAPMDWERGFWSGGNVPEYEAIHERANGEARGELPELEVNARNLVDEQEGTISAEQAKKEASRCLSCGRPFEANQTCWFCLPCEVDCPTQALEVRIPYLVR